VGGLENKRGHKFISQERCEQNLLFCAPKEPSLLASGFCFFFCIQLYIARNSD
jgi:hypothetical protein